MEFQRTVCDAMAISIYKKAAVLTITKIRYAPYDDSIYYSPLMLRKVIFPRGMLDLGSPQPPPHTPPSSISSSLTKLRKLQHAYSTLSVIPNLSLMPSFVFSALSFS